MTIVKLRHSDNSLSIKHISRDIKLVRVGRPGTQGPPGATGPQGPPGPEGPPGTQLVEAYVGPDSMEYPTDGVNDHVQINQAIIDVNAAGGGTVLIAAGDYHMGVYSGTYSIRPLSNVHVKGSGRGVTNLVLDDTADIRRLWFNDGTVVGEEFVENFTLSDMTCDMNNRQSMGLEIRQFRYYHGYNLEWKNILCGTIGGAGRWGNKFGTIFDNNDVEASQSTGLHIHDSIYRDNFTRTVEIILCTNVQGGEIHGNTFINNSSITPNYDEVSLFIYNDDIDYHDNLHFRSKFHGIGTKESFRTKIHDNIFVKDVMWNTSYAGVRAWNTADCSIQNNTMIFPELISVTANIVATGEQVILNPGQYNESITTTTSTIVLTDSTTTDMYNAQSVYGTAIPESARVIQIDSPTQFKINKVASALVNGTTLRLGHASIGITHADRNIGYDLRPQRNEYTRNLTIKDNKIRNAYIGVHSGAASLGVDVLATMTVTGGTTVTVTAATVTIEGVTTTDYVDTTRYLFVGEKFYGTGIPLNARIVSVDSDTQVTVDLPIPDGDYTSVTFDANTIAYRQSGVHIIDNEFPGLLQHAVRWGTDHPDTDVTDFVVKGNIITKWWGTGAYAISLHGYRSDVSRFNDIYVIDNIIGQNLNATDNGGILLDGVTAERVKNNVIPTYGTKGRVGLTSGSIINDKQDNFITYTANKTLSFEDYVLVDATAGNITIAPPAPINYFGKEYVVTKMDSSSHSVIIDPTGAYLINGVTSISLTSQYDTIRFKSNGLNWYALSTNKQSTLQQAFDAGNTITMANGSNKTLTITNNDVTNNQDIVSVVNATTGDGVQINQNGVLAGSKYAMFIDSNAVQVNSELMKIRQDNASSTASAMNIQQDGTGRGMLMNQNGNGNGIEILKTITNAAQTTGAMKLTVTSVVTDGSTIAKSGSALQIIGAVSQTSGTITDTAALLDVIQNNAASTGPSVLIDNNGTGSGVLLTQDGTLTLNRRALEVQINSNLNSSGARGALIYSNFAHTNASNPLLRTENDNAAAINDASHIVQDGTGKALFIDNNNTGASIDVDQDASSASAVTSVVIDVDNAGAGGATALSIPSPTGVGGNVTGIKVAAPTGGTTNYAIQLSDTGGTAAGGITFGTDTTLYRSAADTLKTDDSLVVTGTITASNFSGTNTGDQTASTVANTPAGNIAATNVQAALNELDTEKAIDTSVVHLAGAETITGNKTFSGTVTLAADPSTSLQAATKQYVDGRTATNISNTPAGNVAATNVQAAINELDTEKASKTGTETLTNKTIDTDGGNVLLVRGMSLTSTGTNTGTYTFPSVSAPTTVVNTTSIQTITGEKTFSGVFALSGGYRTVPASRTSSVTLSGTSVELNLCDATSAAIVITLPSAVGISGQRFTFKKVDATANTVTIQTVSSQTIDGSTTNVLSAQWAVVRIVSNGTAWFIL